MTLPSSVSNLIMVFSVLLLTAILFGNSILVIIALIPFLLLMVGLLLKLPSDISAQRKCPKDKLFTGDLLQITVDIEIRSGLGVCLIADELPSCFELVEGSNYKLTWKGLGNKTVRMSYAAKCFTPGTFHLNSLKWESRHSLYNQICKGTAAEDLIIEVRPGLLEVGKIRNTSNVTQIPTPLGSIAKMGIPTLNFKEIRLYNPGDSFRSINWKATARNLYQGNHWPIINEYDKEGKKVVLLYLDTSKPMDFGSNIRDTFECGIEAVNGLADYYLRQNYFVGLCSYGGESVFIYPGTGKKQYYKILKELTALNNCRVDTIRHIPKKMLSLEEAVDAHKKHFAGTRPLFVVVTRYFTHNLEVLSEGINEMTKYTANIHGRFQIMVVNISGYDLAAVTETEKYAGDFLESRNRLSSRELRKKCVWIDWNPSRSSFTSALLKQVVKK